MNQLIIDITGYVATFLTMTSLLPQLYKLIKTKDTAGVSTQMFVLIASSALVWIAYGVMLKSIPLLLTNVVALTVASLNLFLIFKYRVKQ